MLSICVFQRIYPADPSKDILTGTININSYIPNRVLYVSQTTDGFPKVTLGSINSPGNKDFNITIPEGKKSYLTIYDYKNGKSPVNLHIQLRIKASIFSYFKGTDVLKFNVKADGKNLWMDDAKISGGWRVTQGWINQQSFIF